MLAQATIILLRCAKHIDFVVVVAWFAVRFFMSTEGASVSEPRLHAFSSHIALCAQLTHIHESIVVRQKKCIPHWIWDAFCKRTHTLKKRKNCKRKVNGWRFYRCKRTSARQLPVCCMPCVWIGAQRTKKEEQSARRYAHAVHTHR